jgi:hypothetical protein
VVVSTLAAAPGNGTTTLWKMQAPDRLDGRELGTGAGAVIIGHRRWDRDSAREPWVESPQTPLHQPSPPWPPGFEDAHVVGSTVLHGRRLAVVSFLDPVTPSWFAIDVDPATGRTYAMDMIATAHFMHEDYRGFDAPLTIRPPR